MNKIPGLRVALVVVSAVVPLLGVLWWGWDVREVLLLYWVENVLIGCWQVVKMVGAKGTKAGPKFLFVPFFMLHYGGFCAGHAGFIFALTKDSEGGDGGGLMFLLAILAMFVSQGLQTWDSYFASGRFREADAGDLMFEPYKHVVVVHVAIVLGGALAMSVDDALPVLVMIVLGKLGIDLRGIWKERRERGEAA